MTLREGRTSNHVATSRGLPLGITPYLLLYALHDALLKPMPGAASAPSLAESWTMSRDGLAVEFTLRQGARFHNGDPVTAADVKFSFERYEGGAPSTAP